MWKLFLWQGTISDGPLAMGNHANNYQAGCFSHCTTRQAVTTLQLIF